MTTAEKKALYRLIPFLFVLYIISFMDRVNFGFAALEMNKSLGIGPATFGILSGIMFVTYVILEIPSNLVLSKVGARIWIARIMLTWGIVVILTGFATRIWHLYTLRLLLGAAEAGFFPGIIYYLSKWFPESSRARATGFFMCAVPAANLICAPLSGIILDHSGWFGLEGWRWIFILEGIPAIILAAAVFFFLPEKPSDVTWLTVSEKDELAGLEGNILKEKITYKSLKDSFSMRFWALGLVYSFASMNLYGISFWLPRIIKDLPQNLSNTAIGFAAAVPYLITIFLMQAWAIHSDIKNERYIHSVAALFLSAASLFGFYFVSGNILLTLVIFSLACSGQFCFYGPFWPIPSVELKDSSDSVKASALALVNSIGNIGSFFGPYAIGMIAQKSSPETGMVILGLIPLCRWRAYAHPQTARRKIR
jgi:MFS transporter, ACS family, tartrate transporter